MRRYGGDMVVGRGHVPALVAQNRAVVEHMVPVSTPVVLPEPRHRISSGRH